MFNVIGYIGKLWVILVNCIKILLLLLNCFVCGFIYEFMFWGMDDREGLIGENVYLRVGGVK